MASCLCHLAAGRESTTWPMLLLIIISLSASASAESTVNYEMLQMFEIYKARKTCLERIASVTIPKDGGVYCEPVWDNVTCWPNYVKAGESAIQACPSYIQGFNPFELATRLCTDDGKWETHPSGGTNKSWTNFNNCLKSSAVPAIIEEHMPIVIKISTIGYSISLGALIIAMLIMVLFKKLHCQRNTIHVNLFLSFILRAVISLLRNMLLVQHLALPSDIEYAENGRIIFTGGPHWECKLLNTLWQYSLSANYMWIFVEGLYLHTLIFTVFSKFKRFFKFYIIIGWGFPLVFIIFWVIARIFKNNTFCWNTHDMGYYWILNAPIVASISVNFFFFLNVTRVLFTKIRDCNTRDPRRYRKLAKSTLVLIPLFGVYYMFFILLSLYQEAKVVVVHMYMEMSLNSFQGTVVALLFCFLNGEVRAEIKKKWHRHWLRRQSIISGRSSRAFSTTFTYIGGKQQFSLTQGALFCDIAGSGEATRTPTQLPTTKQNCDIFHKVSSMPKLSLNSFPGFKPIPRVSSSSRVSYDSRPCCPDGSSLNIVPFGSIINNAENKKLSKGVMDLSKCKEEHSLSSDSLRVPKDDSENEFSWYSQFKCRLNEPCAINDCKFRGAKDDVDSLAHVPRMSELPPLPDVAE